jgi:hypothetical protein
MTRRHEWGREDLQLARYLLGELSEEEADHIDERSITEDGVAWRLRRMEDDLIDAYVTGKLTGDARQRFTHFYLSSARHRDRVRFAEHFLRIVDRRAPPRRS